MRHCYTIEMIKFLISDEDFDFVINLNWYFIGGYIRCQSRCDCGRQLHYLISDRMGFDYPKIVRHIDGDGLNNQRNNLEIVS